MAKESHQPLVQYPPEKPIECPHFGLPYRRPIIQGKLNIIEKGSIQSPQQPELRVKMHENAKNLFNIPFWSILSEPPSPPHDISKGYAPASSTSDKWSCRTLGPCIAQCHPHSLRLWFKPLGYQLVLQKNAVKWQLNSMKPFGKIYFELLNYLTVWIYAQVIAQVCKILSNQFWLHTLERQLSPRVVWICHLNHEIARRTWDAESAQELCLC